MAAVGDGTGMEDLPKQQGQTANEDKAPNPGGEDGGTGAKLEPGGNRSSPK